MAQSDRHDDALCFIADALCALRFVSLYQRRHLRIPLWEALQLTLGLSIPPLLSLHFVGTRMSHEWFGVDDSYALLVLTLWHASPWDGFNSQQVLITVAWLHGCIGFHFWLRLRSWYRRAAPIFLGCALLLPVMALLGFSQAGHQVNSLIGQDPGWIAGVLEHAACRRAASASRSTMSTISLF